MACATAASPTPLSSWAGSGNSSTLVVDGFPCVNGGGAGQINVPNTPYVSVKICAPASTTNCQIIDHVSVDTGSSGLRIVASALQSSLQPGPGGLPLVTTNGGASTLTECEAYVSSYVYGPVVNADVYVAGKLVSGTSMQVLGATNYTAPASCSQQGGTATETTSTFGANGLIGLSFDLADNYALYYDCTGPSGLTCSPNESYAGIPNTASQFDADNNGVLISLPAVASSGSTTEVDGLLVFGIGTQANNTPSSSAVSLANDSNFNDPNYLTFNATSDGSWTTAYLDTGTDAVYFQDPALAQCSSSGAYAVYFCPASTANVVFSLANYGSTTSAYALDYSVVDPSTIGYAMSVLAASNVAGPASTEVTTSDQTIAFGLSTHFGRNIYVLFNGMTGKGLTGTGPVNGID
jgi:hypothetical protein